MMWYPARGAFRAGRATGTQWSDANTGDYSVALGLDTRAQGNQSIALGNRATAAGETSIALGEDVLAGGTSAIALGYHASTGVRQGSFVFGDRSSTATVLAPSSHAATWRTACGFQIFTNSAMTGGVAFGGGAVSDVGGCPVSPFGQSGAMIATSTGAYLSAGGTWTNASDRKLKHRFAAVAGDEVLATLRDLPITTWSYKVDPDRVRHMGPMAQDCRAAFRLGSDSVSIGTVDADGVALAAAKALEARTRALAHTDSLVLARLDALAQDNARLRRQVASLQTEQRAQRATRSRPVTPVRPRVGTVASRP
jgi:hypothetical protein